MFSHQNNAALVEAIRFCLVGIAAASTYFACSLLLKIHFGISLTAAAAYSFSVVAPAVYFLNYRWTFRSSRAHSSSLPRFVVSSACGIIINSAVVALGVRASITPHGLVLLLGATLVAAVNYVLSKFWVFIQATAQDEK